MEAGGMTHEMSTGNVSSSSPARTVGGGGAVEAPGRKAFSITHTLDNYPTPYRIP